MGRSKGRHRAPSTTAVTATRLAAVGAATLAPVGVLTPLAGASELEPTTATGTQPAIEVDPLVDWSAIIKCESGGNPKAENPRSTASGLLQFIDGSWRYYGGTKYAKRASDATPAQQIEIGNAAYARDGLGPWAASRHCWGKHERQIKSGTTPTPAPKPAPVAPAPAPTAEAPAPQGVQLGARDRHGRGWYRCDDAHQRFELCDPNTKGQVFQYPAYAGHNVPPLPGGSAVAPMAHATPLRAAAPAPAPASNALGQAFLATARTYIGTPYRWGGNGRSGIDCSGLVQQSLKARGVRSPRTAHEQMRWSKRITRAQARPGDLAFLVNKSGRATHVGIVIGNGRWLEAPYKGQRVREHPIPARAVFGRVPGS